MTEGTVAATERLYYTNAFLTAFAGRLLALRLGDDNSGDAGAHAGQTGVALDRSAFYPTSGGQPHDTGTLGGLHVLDVTVDEGVVWHWVEGAPPWTPGDVLEGAIDWPRRFDHMQQHSAQHLLSQVFARLFEAETLSVHFGAEESTLDLDMAALEPAQMKTAEALAAETVYAARPILAYTVDEAGLNAIPLRRPPKVTGAIRIVEIEGFDWSACGGTHVHTTAEAGPIKIVRSERRRGGVRLTFLAGGRAVADYQRKHTLLAEAAALFSSDAAQVPALVERQIAVSKEQARRLEEVTGRLLALEAAALLSAARPLADLPAAPLLVQALRDDLDAASLRTLAGQVVAQAPDAGAVALLASAQQGKLLLAFACTPGLPLHMGNLLRATLQQAGGNGGGRPDFAQGGGVPAAEGERLLAYAASTLSLP